MTKKRIEEVDIMKGIGILTIAAVHLVYRSQGGTADHIFRTLGWLLIGVFFMLSGFSFTPGKRTILKSYLARLRYLLLPAVITETILLIVGGIYCMLLHGYTLTDCLHDCIVTVIRPEWGRQISEEWGNGGLLYDNLSPSWFIWTMMWADLLFIPIAEWCGHGNRKLRLWLSVIVLTAVQIPIYMLVQPLSWLVQLAPLFTVFMLIGMIVRDAGLFKREWKLNPWLTALISLAGFAASVGIFSLGGDNYFMGYIGIYGNGIDVLLPIIQLVPGTIAYYALARLIMKLRVLSACIIWIGKRTLIFLMCHCFFGMIAADLMGTYIRMGPMWYLEDSGLSVTPEILIKSLIGLAASVICCSIVCFTHDRISAKLRKPDKKAS